MHTGDGIQRVSDVADALLAPVGGEGGSVLQALGSKGESQRELRAKRRKEKKDSYAEYLKSEEWKKLRARALRRDKKTCRACGKPAAVVHHIRYPKNLGQERLDWLYSLCSPCHNRIHRLAEEMTLRKATHHVLETRREGNVVYLPDDPQLDPAAAKRRNLKGRGHEPGKKKRKRKGLPKTKRMHKSKALLIAQNEALREEFARNRERRERRWQR